MSGVCELMGSVIANYGVSHDLWYYPAPRTPLSLPVKRSVPLRVFHVFNGNALAMAPATVPLRSASVASPAKTPGSRLSRRPRQASGPRPARPPPP